MSTGDGVGDLDRDLDRAADVHWQPCHFSSQRLSFQELEDKIDATVVLTNVEQRRDIRVRQRDQRPGVLHETPRGVGISREIRRQPSHRDGATVASITRSKEFAWAIGVEALEQVVVGYRADRGGS